MHLRRLLTTFSGVCSTELDHEIESGVCRHHAERSYTSVPADLGVDSMMSLLMMMMLPWLLLMLLLLLLLRSTARLIEVPYRMDVLTYCRLT